MNIIPTWKNAAYRQSLTAGAQARLSVNPIGEVELTDADLEAVHGGSGCGGDSGLLNGNNSHNGESQQSSPLGETKVSEGPFRRAV